MSGIGPRYFQGKAAIQWGQHSHRFVLHVYDYCLAELIFKPHMEEILDQTLNNCFDGSSCPELRIIILNSHSSNLHTRSNRLELYFRTVSVIFVGITLLKDVKFTLFTTALNRCPFQFHKFGIQYHWNLNNWKALKSSN